MTWKRQEDNVYVDANGCLTEHVDLGGQSVVIHYDDVPDSDVTTVNGIPCTTALRTVIDIAPDVGADELKNIVQHCLERGLFTVGEALARTAETDMLTRRGAHLLRQALPR